MKRIKGRASGATPVRKSDSGRERRRRKDATPEIYRIRSDRRGFSIRSSDTVDVPRPKALEIVTVTVRELHLETGKLIREAAVLGGMDITYRGRVIAEIVPKREPPIVSFFSRQKLSPGFRRLQASGKLARGTDSTTAISEDREDRV